MCQDGGSSKSRVEAKQHDVQPANQPLTRYCTNWKARFASGYIVSPSSSCCWPSGSSQFVARVLISRLEHLASVVRIPTQAGHCFRFEGGRVSDLKPDTIPK
jgi:hypothetical protein